MGEPSICREGKVAAMRLALMAQTFERAAIQDLDSLDPYCKNLLIREMSRTGCEENFKCGPGEVGALSEGPALLVYYAPALIQKAKETQCAAALQVLAAVY